MNEYRQEERNGMKWAAELIGVWLVLWIFGAAAIYGFYKFFQIHILGG